ncbi:MAG TPA: bifunctional DedA family/phosphatase PAP2 family protein [Actinomycetota bacterium]|nr:bifunctional DedA family/phosphatase PAP2 family protein [Actinomycetota bacterium]
MTASIPDLILGLPAGVALLIVFLIPALEASAFLGFVFPGEIAVILGGVLASQGKFPLWAAIVAAVLGAVVGDSIGYEVGKRWGDRIVHASFGRLPIIRRRLDEHLDEAREYVRRRGPRAVLAGRFTAALRVLVPGLAGMADLPYPTFLLFNAIGAVLWGTTFALLGYLAGAAWHRVAADASRAGLALLALVLIGLVTARVLRAVREHGTAAADRLASLRPARWFRGRYPNASAWLARRVDPSARRGFRLSVAVVAAALALWLFGGLTQDVVANDDAALRDPGITSWIVAHRVAWLTGVMRSVTWAGSVVVLIPLALVVGLTVLRSARTARPLIQLAAALGASILLYNVVRALVDRPRPPIADRLVRVSGPSFPSGHSADSAAVYVMLALLLLASGHDGRRLAIAAALLVMPVVVASSRLYLGVHWFTDVLAGLALGCAIVAVVIAVTMLLPPRRGEPPGGDRPSPVPDRVGAGGEG